MWLRDTRGQDLIEYALVAGFIALATVAVAPGMTDNLNTIASKVNSVLVFASDNQHGVSATQNSKGSAYSIQPSYKMGEKLEYVVRYTNAPTLINEEYGDAEDLAGVFSGFDSTQAVYDPKSWRYDAEPRKAPTNPPLRATRYPIMAGEKAPTGCAA